MEEKENKKGNLLKKICIPVGIIALLLLLLIGGCGAYKAANDCEFARADMKTKLRIMLGLEDDAEIPEELLENAYIPDSYDDTAALDADEDDSLLLADNSDVTDDLSDAEIEQDVEDEDIDEPDEEIEEDASEDQEEEALDEEDEALEEEDNEEETEDGDELKSKNKKLAASSNKRVVTTSASRNNTIKLGSTQIDPALLLYLHNLNILQNSRFPIVYTGPSVSVSSGSGSSDNNSSGSSNSSSSSSSSRPSSSSSSSSTSSSGSSTSSSGSSTSSSSGSSTTDPGNDTSQNDPAGGGSGLTIDPDKRVFVTPINATLLANVDSKKLVSVTYTPVNRNTLEVKNGDFKPISGIISKVTDDAYVNLTDVKGKKANKPETLIMYMIGSDLESNNSEMTTDIFNLLSQADYNPDKLNILICIGGTEKFGNGYFGKAEGSTGGDNDSVDGINLDAKDGGGCALFYVDVAAAKDYIDKAPKDPGTNEPIIDNGILNADTLRYLGNFVDNTNGVSSDYCTMTDPAMLTSVLDFAYDNFPSDEYSLTLSSHGGGITGGFGSQPSKDDGSNNSSGRASRADNTSLSMPDLEKALASSKLYSSEGNNKLGFIGYDACMMGGLETSLVMAPYAEYLVASAEVTSGGWEYAKIAKFMADNYNDQTKRVDGLAEFVAKSYAEQDTHLNISDTDYLIACFDSEAVEGAKDSINAVSTALTELKTGLDKIDDKQYFNLLHHARSAAYSYGNSNALRDDNENYDFVDVKDFYRLLKEELIEYKANTGNLGTNVTGKIDAAVAKIDKVLEFADITQGFVNWLGYSKYDPTGTYAKANNLGTGTVGGSQPGCFSMYMPYLYAPTAPAARETDPAYTAYTAYTSNKYMENYNDFLNDYITASRTHLQEMKDIIAPVIDYNKIFKAQIGVLNKNSGTVQIYGDEYEATNSPYGKDEYTDNVKTGVVASTVVRFSIKEDTSTDAQTYVDDLIEQAKTNGDELTYDDVRAFEAFHDTVNKITAVTTRKVVIGEDTDPSSGAKVNIYGDLVVAKKDVCMADISANTIDIGINEYNKAITYKVIGQAKAGAAPIYDYATLADNALLTEKELTDPSGGEVKISLLDQMRKELATKYKNASAADKPQNDTDGEWLAIQGKITHTVADVSGGPEKDVSDSAVLHFWKNGNNNEYTLVGTSIIRGFDSDNSVNYETKTTDAANKLVSVSFYHYVIGDSDGSEKLICQTTIDSALMGDAKKAAEDVVQILTDINSTTTDVVTMTEPVFDPANIKIVMQNLTECDPTEEDGTNTLLAQAEKAYDQNSQNGYSVIIESTSGDTTAVAPVYQDQEAAEKLADDKFAGADPAPDQTIDTSSGSSSGRSPSTDSSSDSSSTGSDPSGETSSTNTSAGGSTTSAPQPAQTASIPDTAAGDTVNIPVLPAPGDTQNAGGIVTPEPAVIPTDNFATIVNTGSEGQSYSEQGGGSSESQQPSGSTEQGSAEQAAQGDSGAGGDGGSAEVDG